MKVFLAGIIQGSKVAAEIHHQDWREFIRRLLERHAPQAEVYCHYSNHPDSITYDLPRIIETFDEGVARAIDCDVLIAYLPSASMGTAIEMYEAYRSGAAVITITPMSANWVVRAYSDRILPDLAALEGMLASGDWERLLAKKKP
jgi:TRAP-type C4-dicarboxylate transport system substrate-binding protein